MKTEPMDLSKEDVKNLSLQVAGEASEVGHMAAKTGCYGRLSFNPEDPDQISNIVLLGWEIGNLLHVADLLGVRAEDIAEGRVMKESRLKKYGIGG